MSDVSGHSNYNKTLLEALASIQAKYPATVKIATKRSKHSARFAERIQKNAEIADQLIVVMKSLTRKPDTVEDVDKLLDITKSLLDNNAKLREQVGEALQDIPN